MLVEIPEPAYHPVALFPNRTSWLVPHYLYVFMRRGDAYVIVCLSVLNWCFLSCAGYVPSDVRIVGKGSKRIKLTKKAAVAFIRQGNRIWGKSSHDIEVRRTYLLTPCCKVLLEKLTVLQLVKKFPAFHGTRRSITALTSVRHVSLSWASPIQSIYPHPTSWRSVLILSTHLRLGLPSGLFPSCFPTNTLYTPLSSPIRATCPAHLILLDVITHTILGE